MTMVHTRDNAWHAEHVKQVKSNNDTSTAWHVGDA